jgi:hypothetical protein
MVTARVEALIAFYIEVPEGTDKSEVLSFVANNVSYTDAFQGVSDPEQTMRVTDVNCLVEEVTDLDMETEDE